MLLIGIPSLRNSAIAPALIASLFMGCAAYWCNSQIETFGRVARNDLRSFTTSVPREIASLGSEFAYARKQVVSASRKTGTQILLASREFRSVIKEQGFRRVLSGVHPSGNITLALLCGVACFLLVYYRVIRKPSGAHPRLKVF